MVARFSYSFLSYNTTSARINRIYRGRAPFVAMSVPNSVLWQRPGLFRAPLQLQTPPMSSHQRDQHSMHCPLAATLPCAQRKSRHSISRVNADQSGSSVSTAEGEMGTSSSGAAADGLLDGTGLELARSEASLDTRSIENYNAEILKGGWPLSTRKLPAIYCHSKCQSCHFCLSMASFRSHRDGSCIVPECLSVNLTM